MEVQLSLFESIVDILNLSPIYLLGLGIVGVISFWKLKKKKDILSFRAVIYSILLYYYLSVLFRHIVGIPTIREIQRVMELGELVFNPNTNFIPFVEGIGLEFILNIVCFIPLGGLCPLVGGRRYIQKNRTVVFGLLLSAIIEISQLFTLYRATDINDLIANTLGTLIGILFYRMVIVHKKEKYGYNNKLENDSTQTQISLIFIVAIAYIFTFISN